MGDVLLVKTCSIYGFSVAAKSVTGEGFAAVGVTVTVALLLGADTWPVVSVTTTVNE